jgi:RNA polymerase sigma factor (sigma-70 family)
MGRAARMRDSYGRGGSGPRAAEELETVSLQSSLESAAEAEVLARFIKHREDAAFAELVRRHGPAVRAACRRALGDTPDAEDAFQVAFVILARKAATVRNAALVGPWLHTVAVRAANRIQRRAGRRQNRERQVSSMSELAEAPASSEPSDWLPLLDAEIQALPKRLRIPLVLCELEGTSRAEAARVLGLKEGTLSSQLARARETLRKRLQRRGALIAGVGLAAAFTTHLEALSAQVVAATTQTALTGPTPASVTALTGDVLKGMLWAKVKTAFLAVAALAGVVAGVSYLILGGQTDMDKLQGTWEFVSVQAGGKELQGPQADQMKKGKLVIKDGEINGTLQNITFTLDSSKRPKEIDLVMPADRSTWKGIYELKGDELKICTAAPNEGRPTAFETRAGKMIMLIQLKRTAP